MPGPAPFLVLILLAGLLGGMGAAGGGGKAATPGAAGDRAPATPRVEEPGPAGRQEHGLAAYLHLASQDGGAGDARAGPELQRGVRAASRGEVEAAVGAFEAAAAAFPGIGDWTRLLAAEALAPSGDTAGVLRRLAAVEPDLRRDRGWRALARARASASDPAGAAREAEAAAAELEGAGLRGAALVEAAKARLEAADTAAARSRLLTALEVAPDHASGLEAARLLERGVGGRTAAQRLASGRVLLRHREYGPGVAALDAAAAEASGAERAALRLEVARALFQSRRYADVESRAHAVARDGGPDSLVAEASFLLGRALYRQGRVADARQAFLGTVERFPRQPVASEALFIVADLHHDEGELDAARERYRQAVEARPGADPAAEAAMRLGGLAYLDGDFGTAARVFDEYRLNHPAGWRHLQASYWAGRAHLRLGDPAAATERLRAAAADPVSWYGMRSADLLEDDPWPRILTAPPVTAPEVSAWARGAAARMDLLRSAGLVRAAEHEMERVRRLLEGHDGGLHALAEAIQARGDVFGGVRVGRELQRRQGGWDERLLRIVYPFPYRGEIEAVSRKRDLDPYLVAGLIRQESMFDPAATSAAGAVGLMQVLPATGRSLAPRAGLRGVDSRALRRPDVNLELGALFLSDLLRRYDGRLGDVLVAYNAGSTRLARWRSHPEYADEEIFAERIPFPETREYVRVVLQNARIYRALYGEEGGPAPSWPAGSRPAR